MLGPGSLDMRCSQDVRRGQVEGVHSDWPPARTPTTGFGLEYAVTTCAAASAAAVRGKVPGRDVIPVAPDEHCTAAMTMGALAGRIVDIASVDIAKAGFHCDFPCLAQGL